MSEMTDELLGRIAERAKDPRRRYMTAADDEALVRLPVEEIERQFGAAGDVPSGLFRDMLSRLNENGFPTSE
jgi:hypothetical protein